MLQQHSSQSRRIKRKARNTAVPVLGFCLLFYRSTGPEIDVRAPQLLELGPCLFLRLVAVNYIVELEKITLPLIIMISDGMMIRPHFDSQEKIDTLFYFIFISTPFNSWSWFFE